MSVLILSSHVATSDVGGSAQVVAFARAGIETVFAPTVLFGRHPGLGAPGGGPVGAEVFAGMLEGIAAAGVLMTLDAVITGYFASAEQVAIAARTLDAARAASPDVRIIVDPIMGDHGKGLYVDPAVADAIVADLTPRADLIAPNAWELERLTGHAISDPATALVAARSLGKAVLVSSVAVGDEIGVVYADGREAWLASHARQSSAPNGTGDRLTALFTIERLGGTPPDAALRTSVKAVAEMATGAPVAVRVTRWT